MSDVTQAPARILVRASYKYQNLEIEVPPAPGATEEEILDRAERLFRKTFARLVRAVDTPLDEEEAIPPPPDDDPGPSDDLRPDYDLDTLPPAGPRGQYAARASQPTSNWRTFVVQIGTKYKGQTIQQILDSGNRNFLVWVVEKAERIPDDLMAAAKAALAATA